MTVQIKWVEAKGTEASHAVHVYKNGGGGVAMVLQYRERPPDRIDHDNHDTTWQTVPVELNRRDTAAPNIRDASIGESRDNASAKHSVTRSAESWLTMHADPDYV